MSTATIDPVDAPETSWFPSRYGARDEAGALNEAGPANVVRAASLVRTGQIFDLAHVLAHDFDQRMV